MSERLPTVLAVQATSRKSAQTVQMIIPEWELVDASGADGGGINNVSMVGRIVGHEWAAWVSSGVPQKVSILPPQAPATGVVIGGDPDEIIETIEYHIDAPVAEFMLGMFQGWHVDVAGVVDIEDARALAQLRTLVTPRRILEAVAEKFDAWVDTAVDL